MAFYSNMNMLGPFFTSLFSLCFGLTVLIFAKQPKPYMDEVFHVPQVQKYCEHRFDEWDPMITTLPGLYFYTWLFIETLAMIMNQDVTTLCIPFFLRIINVLFNIGNIWVVYRILRKLKELEYGISGDKPKNANNSTNDLNSGEEKFHFSLTALTLGIFPLSFFFMFLYYTDNGSTFFVLLMYYLSLGDWHFCAAVVGVNAIFFRQTNIVWVVFTAGVTAVRMLQPKMSDPKQSSVGIVMEFVRQMFINLKDVLCVLWPYITVLALFGLFVHTNGGIAVGDKTHHQVSLNFPQVFYFACFAVFFSFSHITSPRIIYDVFVFLRSLLQRRYHAITIVVLFVVYYLVQHYTYVHPYLLADNRHYPFYIWKNIYLAYPQAKVTLIPVYLLAVIAIFVSIDRPFLWKIVYAVCVCTVLIPQALLEFRYFIIPYLMYRIHIRRPGNWKLGAEFVLYTAVNFFTLWIFIKKTFHWPTSSEIQRFMW